MMYPYEFAFVVSISILGILYPVLLDMLKARLLGAYPANQQSDQ